MNDINLSLIDLFIQATVVVQGVLLLLLAASLLGWSVIIEKALTLRRLGRQAGSFEQLRASLASRPQTRGDGLAGDFSMFSRRMNLGIARFARQLVDLEAAP